MQAIVDTIQFVINIIAEFGQFVLDCFTQIFVDLYEIGTDFPVWVFEQILSLIVVILEGVSELPGVETISDATSYFGNIPAEMMNMLGLIGFGYALSIIAAALVIRFTLGLIPFVRIGR